MAVTPALASSSTSAHQGLVITTSTRLRPRRRPGLKASRTGAGADVIIACDGTKINNYDDLANFLDTKKVGDTVQVKVIRDGKETTVPVTLDAWVDNSA